MADAVLALAKLLLLQPLLSLALLAVGALVLFWLRSGGHLLILLSSGGLILNGGWLLDGRVRLLDLDVRVLGLHDRHVGRNFLHLHLLREFH